jgi:hypothetical protein
MFLIQINIQLIKFILAFLMLKYKYDFAITITQNVEKYIEKKLSLVGILLIYLII